MVQLLVTLIALNALYLRSSGSVIGDRDILVQNDNEIYLEDAPYMAAVYLNNEYKCGAVIIDDYAVLTAATCYYAEEWTPDYMWKVLVGTDQLNTGGHFIDVENVVCHEKYNDTTIDNNICLIILSKPVPFGSIWNVNKVLLPEDGRHLLEGTMVTITGWGYTDNNLELVGNELRQITVLLISNETCGLLYPYVNENQICAGSRDWYPCTGDAGGPLVYNGMLIGLISYGWSDCDRKPTVFTNVFSYKPWIDEMKDGFRKSISV